ncbi:hypothetical protein KJ707_02110 [Patescibacteria group bacterium]|nr:hypothetical protein [Patescibacteria group bacterium]MBU1967001.1 hypothetical protein [Patescibacteria group bacterium]MBU2543334.1 hypothetical protein [Patescibacteria group bacterium]
MSDRTQPTAQPMSSREYLEALRQKRDEHLAQTPPAPSSTTTSPPTATPETTTVPPSTTEEKKKANQKKEDLFPGIPKPRPKKTIITWSAPSRPFKKRDRRYYTTVILIVFLISLILFFAGQFLPIAVVISVGFLAYVLSSVPPHEVKIEITTYGIEVEDFLYYWEEMGRFWFDKKYNQELLTIETMRFPGRIILLFDKNEKEDLKKLLSEVLFEEKPADTFYDKAAKWLQEKIPLEVGS